LPQPLHDAVENVHGAGAAAHGPGTQPGGQREAAVTIQRQQREILVLAVVAVVAGQRLVAVGRIVGGIQVNDHVRRRLPACADEPIDEEVVEYEEAVRLRGVHVVEGGAVFGRQFVLAAREGVLEARQGRAAGQGVVRIGTDVGKSLEHGITAGVVGVVGVGITGEELIDVLGEEILSGVGDEGLVARIRKTLGEVGEKAEAFLEGAQGQQSGIFDELAAVEGDSDLLPVEGPEVKVRRTVCRHENSLRVFTRDW
jgi:hypothetical protein